MVHVLSLKVSLGKQEMDIVNVLSPEDGETVHQDWFELAVQGLLAVTTISCNPPRSLKDIAAWSTVRRVSFSQDGKRIIANEE